MAVNPCKCPIQRYYAEQMNKCPHGKWSIDAVDIWRAGAANDFNLPPPNCRLAKTQYHPFVSSESEHLTKGNRVVVTTPTLLRVLVCAYMSA